MNEPLYYHLTGSSGMAMGLSSQVAGELGRRIVCGVYQPGDLVEDEDAAARRFRVSRTIIREAIKILSAKGLITVRRGVGTRVTPRSDWRLLDEDVLAWHQAAPPCPRMLMRLMEVRAAMEPAAAGWAALRATENDVRKINVAIENMEKTSAHTESFVIADAGFHSAILKAAHNEFLTALEGVIYAALLTSIRLTNKTPDENILSIPFHRTVAEAIAGRDEHEAAGRMRRLLDDASKRLAAMMATLPPQ